MLSSHKHSESEGDKLVDLGWNPACEIEIHESLALPGS